MLVNSQGQTVNISNKIDSSSHPLVFARVREVLEPTPKYVGNMFHMETRAKIINLR